MLSGGEFHSLRLAPSGCGRFVLSDGEFHSLRLASSGCGRFVLSGGEFHSLRLMAQIGEDRIYLSVAAAVQDFEQRNQEENK